MRSGWHALLAVAFMLALASARTAHARELNTSIDLNYGYAQVNLGDDVEAATAFTQKYEIRYETALTSSHDFFGAVRLDLQNAWFTNQASTSRVSPTLELSTKGSQLATKLAYEAVIGTLDSYLESGEVTGYSSSLSFDLLMTPRLWPEVKLKFQRRKTFQDYTKEGSSNSLELSLRKDIYRLRLEYNIRREELENVLPERNGSAETRWSAKASYKEALWYGTEFELGYEIKESYKDSNTRGYFTGESQSYTHLLKTRLRNSLLIAPRITLGLVWEYQYEQDLLALDFDYNLSNKYGLDLRWDAYDWLKIRAEGRHETDLSAVVVGDDERSVIDTINAGFDMTSISWLQVAGKAEWRNEGRVAAASGGSVEKLQEDKYELIVKNRVGDWWDFTWDATSTNKHENGRLTSRETRVKGDLKLKLLEELDTIGNLGLISGYEVGRKNDWDPKFEYPVSQQQVRMARIRFEYQFQLVDLFRATFSHEYGVKVDDSLDEVLNFERQLQYNENTRLTIVLAEIVRSVFVEGEIDRKGSDTEGDADPELVELSYALKLDWVLDSFSLLSTLKYNDKGDTFDDLSFNTKASWRTDRLEVTGEYQFDRIIKDITEPKDEKRKFSLKLYYKF